VWRIHARFNAVKVFCRLCHKPVEGIDIEATMEAMAKHLALHPLEKDKLARQIQMIFMALSSYLVLRQYVNIPAEEKKLIANYEDLESQLFELFAVCPDPDSIAAKFRAEGN
jgi:hypothetical protein